MQCHLLCYMHCFRLSPTPEDIPVKARRYASGKIGTKYDTTSGSRYLTESPGPIPNVGKADSFLSFKDNPHKSYHQ